MPVTYTPWAHQASSVGITEEEEARAKQIIADNKLTDKYSIASFYEKKGLTIGYGCPNLWPAGGSKDLAMEYMLVRMVAMGGGAGDAAGGGGGGGGGGDSGGGGEGGGGDEGGDAPPTDETDRETDTTEESEESSEEAGEEGGGGAGTGPEGNSASPLLNLVSVDTNVFDAKQHCNDVAKTVMNELASREEVQKTLQAARDAEAKAAEAEAFATDEEYIATVEQSTENMMSAASSLPAVDPQDAGSVKSDSGLDAPSSSESSSPQADATGGEAKSTENSADAQQQLQRHGGNCGGRGKTSAPKQEKMLEKAKEAVADKAKAALEAGQAAAATVAGAKTTKDEKLAKELVASDTGKDSALAMAGKATKQLATDIVADLKEGTLTPAKLCKNFDNNMNALGASLGAALSAAKAGVPGVNPCTSQELTDGALGKAGLLATIDKYCDGIAGSIDTASKLIDQAAGIYEYGPEILIHMAESTAQTAGNVLGMAIKGAISGPCKPAVDATGKDSSSKPGAGILHLADSLVGASDSVAHAVNVIDHRDDIAAKGKWLVEHHPVVRTFSDALKDNSRNMTTFSKINKTGIKFPRVTMGTTRQNKLSNVMESINNTVVKKQHYSTSSLPSKPIKHTTTDRVNRYNCYGLLNFKI